MFLLVSPSFLLLPLSGRGSLLCFSVPLSFCGGLVLSRLCFSFSLCSLLSLRCGVLARLPLLLFFFLYMSMLVLWFVLAGLSFSFFFSIYLPSVLIYHGSLLCVVWLWRCLIVLSRLSSSSVLALCSSLSLRPWGLVCCFGVVVLSFCAFSVCLASVFSSASIFLCCVLRVRISLSRLPFSICSCIYLSIRSPLMNECMCTCVGVAVLWCSFPSGPLSSLPI